MVGVANFPTDQDVYFQAEVRHNEGQKENGSKGGHFFHSTYFQPYLHLPPAQCHYPWTFSSGGCMSFVLMIAQFLKATGENVDISWSTKTDRSR